MVCINIVASLHEMARVFVTKPDLVGCTATLRDL